MSHLTVSRCSLPPSTIFIYFTFIMTSAYEKPSPERSECLERLQSLKRQVCDMTNELYNEVEGNCFAFFKCR